MTTTGVSRYHLPQRWLRYNLAEVAMPLVQAKTSAGVLKRLPYLYQWIEQVHEEQLRLEAVGTTRIEGAQFSARQQEEVLSSDTAPASSLTHSQRQLRAANATYRWLRSVEPSRLINTDFVLDIHRRIVTGCDDDRCEPGKLRRDGDNVTFGNPVCRGAIGGPELSNAFNGLIQAISGEFRNHDPIIQALAAHYHLGAMHPFGDGNGRTARALEAFMMRKAGVNDMVMVSLSNYYYEYQKEYRAALHESRAGGHDLTPFLKFALPAIVSRCDALADEISTQGKRILYRQMANSLFGRLRSPRRRVLVERQLQIVEMLLNDGAMHLSEMVDKAIGYYQGLKFPVRAMGRDLADLLVLNALKINGLYIAVNLDWPQQFSESRLLELYEDMPSAVSSGLPTTDLSRLLGTRSLSQNP